ncbi:LLM class flavin-dependent oxidoreductase [[Mycobacterium] burgundiense]|uniref:LLM class flavin-dependent oxidoreductase n=1 Tax=[Mycobacterium] burgundiense TaxID=3064286 RepID=A0ABM9M4C6_9MYCO|nr:LLM class flavin-dependent oxidoreductase [Mycolicibacterium sp. MU0053]CAJ1510012.1 LLM class flavin-dependent oxidoreductase [Mycolicibacterium sp. MU0053]
MEIGIFGGADYQSPAMPHGWPRRPRFYEPELARKAHEDSMMLYELADDIGLDFVTVSEHHYGGPGLEPNCHITAAVLGERMKNARIALLGPNLPMNNPVRLAEEIAQLDLLSGGKIYGVALLRGTPNEVITYFNNPAESRDVWEESVQLILRAWKEPEPFGWEGVHHRFRTIAVWPKFLDAAPPRVMLSGNSLESVDFALKMGSDIAISYGTPEATGRSIERFHDGAAALGREVGHGNVLYRNFVYVAETEERARQECAEHGFGSMTFFRPPTAAAAAVFQESVKGSYGDSAGVTRESLEKPLGTWGAPRFVGTPDQVFEAIREYHQLGVGAMDFSFGGFGLPTELAKKNLEMFARHVLPEVHKLPNSVNTKANANA